MFMILFKLIIVKIQNIKRSSDFNLNIIGIQFEFNLHKSYLHSAQLELLLKKPFVEKPMDNPEYLRLINSPCMATYGRELVYLQKPAAEVQSI